MDYGEIQEWKPAELFNAMIMQGENEQGMVPRFLELGNNG